jgi:hypothetical protein
VHVSSHPSKLCFQAVGSIVQEVVTCLVFMDEYCLGLLLVNYCGKIMGPKGSNRCSDRILKESYYAHAASCFLVPTHFL